MMNQQLKKWTLFSLRWGIAIVGVAWVLGNITVRDTVLALDDRNHPERVALLKEATEDSPTYTVEDSGTRRPVVIDRDRVINERDQKQVQVKTAAGAESRELLGLRLTGDINRNPAVAELLIRDPASGNGVWIEPSALKSGHYEVKVPRPRVQAGLARMIHQANPLLLWASVLVFPITYLITSLRWQALLKALDIRIPLARTFVLNMVGAFYNSFMPGSTGGDVIKAIYASKQTPHKTRAVMSVLIDRILGLLALVILGGSMAAVQYARSDTPNDPATRACKGVALGSVAVLAAGIIGVWVIGHPKVRKLLGFEWLLSKLPMQKQVQGVVDVMRAYKRRPMLVLWALIVSLPVHITVVISAMLAGMAFDLPISPTYYFVCVPVIVLSGSIPISPQGAGVMEFFAIKLTEKQGATLSQAFALTMSIRLVQILWNLTGGILVLRGGYHQPTAAEQKQLESDDPSQDGGPDDVQRQSAMSAHA